MPIYEFICEECGNPFETLIMGFNTDGVECPECQSKNINKKVSSFAVKGNSFGSSPFTGNQGACNTSST